jgi:thiol-disulfide isomerase/thioredoxin
MQGTTRSNLIFFSGLALLLVVYLYVLRPMQRSIRPAHPGVGFPLPQLTFEPFLLDEKPLTTQDLRGKVVLVNFWATWCEVCLRELPHIYTIDKQFQNNPDFQTLLVATSESDVRAAIEDYLQHREIETPVFIDGSGAILAEVGATIGAKGGIPLTLVVDREGIIRGIWEGYAPGVEIEIHKLIEDLLAKPASSG